MLLIQSCLNHGSRKQNVSCLVDFKIALEFTHRHTGHRVRYSRSELNIESYIVRFNERKELIKEGV